MDFVQTLICAGFTPDAAQFLAAHERFRYMDKSAEEVIGVVRDIAETYHCSEENVRLKLVEFPQFGREYKRILKRVERLGALAGLTRQEVAGKIMEKTVLCGYSAKRFIAGLDVGKKLASEGFRQDREMLDKYLLYVRESPYVPDTERLRISQARGGGEPPLLVRMRKNLSKK